MYKFLITIKETPMDQRLSIAVIGTGIAGLSAAWLLNQNHEVTVYEKDTHIGGHCNTIIVPNGKISTAIDTGFIVYNEANYPNLTRLFEVLGVATKESNMSFSASIGGGRFEYSGANLNGLLGQRLNVGRPKFWRMIRDIKRFYKEAPRLLENPLANEVTLDAYLIEEGYSSEFIENHLLPMGAAIWSTTAHDIKNYPAQAFIRFFQSHGLFNLIGRPMWRTVEGGSHQYVKKLIKTFQHRIRTEGARAIERIANGIIVTSDTGNVDKYDHVILATHADQAFKLLKDPDLEEKALLQPWKYTTNRAILHSDSSLMPKRRHVWSSWNFIGDVTGRKSTLCVTYWMNRLQNLTVNGDFFVTLNPISDPDKRLFIQEIEYTHPYFDSQALLSQKQLWSLQGRRRTWFCGSYFGYGFHEDALQSGLAVAETLGEVRRPWKVPKQESRIAISNSPGGTS